MPKKTSTGSALCLKITLDEVKPPVWRRVLIPPDASLSYLHAVIQDAMGWGEEHLYDFMVGSGRGKSLLYTSDSEDHAIFETIAVTALLPRVKSKTRYVYDFGDDWQHTVVLEKKMDPPAGQRLPVCLGGEGACPPEDSGGVWGYGAKLEAFADPTHEYHDDAVEWLGDDFDSTFFDLEAVNRVFAKWRQ